MLHINQIDNDVETTFAMKRWWLMLVILIY